MSKINLSYLGIDILIAVTTVVSKGLNTDTIVSHPFFRMNELITGESVFLGVIQPLGA